MPWLLGVAVGWSSCFRLNLSAFLPTGVYFLIPALLLRPLEHGYGLRCTRIAF